MTELGSFFQNERKKQGLDIEDVATRSKIPLKTLIAIESGDKGSLPAKPFLRGFVRSYAKLLGLDVEASIQLFEKEYGQSGAPLKPKMYQPTEEEATEQPQESESVSIFQAPKSFFMFFGFSITAVLCIFIYIALQKITSYQQEKVSANDLMGPTQPIAGQPDENFANQNPEKKDEASNKEDSSKKDAKNSELVKDKNAKPPKKPEPKKEKVAKVDKVPEIKKEAPLTAKPEVTKPEEPKVDQKAAQAAALKKVMEKPKVSAAAPSQPTSHKLSIEAFEPVRLEVVWSTGSPQVFLLKANEIKNIIFTKPVKILLSDGGVINVTFDDEDRGVPGQIRKPIELKFP